MGTNTLAIFILLMLAFFPAELGKIAAKMVKGFNAEISRKE